jgi:hypothetical protein
MGGAGGERCNENLIVVSSGDHQHTLLVTPAEIAAGMDVTILSSTTEGHAHYVLLTAADFGALQTGMEIRKKSCAGADHEWVLSCNGTLSAPGMPSCSDECGDGITPGNACR